MTNIITCDLFETSEPIFNIAGAVEIPVVSNPGMTAGVPHMIIFNSICPTYAPAMWGGERDEHDMPGFQMVSPYDY